ncbi:MAG: hypothetical protein AAF386_11275 [Pseudomonadota bacterium]
MLLAALSFPVPILVAILFGWRAGSTNPQSPEEFLRAGAFYLAWLLSLVFLWHALWLTSLVPAQWQDTLRAGTSWTLGTGAIWLPIFVIVYVMRAMRERRKG